MQPSDLGLTDIRSKPAAYVPDLTKDHLDTAIMRAFGAPMTAGRTIITRREDPETMDTREMLLFQAQQENDADRAYLDAFNIEAEKWTKALNKWSIRICAAFAVWACIWAAFY